LRFTGHHLIDGQLDEAQYFVDRDSDERGDERLRKVLSEEASTIRDTVVDGFAFAPDSLTNVASPATLDSIVKNTLSIQLGDYELAADAYDDLRQQVIGARQRWYYAHVSVALAPWKDGPAAGAGSMFVATVQWEYRFTPTNSVLRYSCVSDLDAYRELLSDPTSTEEWYFEPINGLDAGSPKAFELVSVTVNGKSRPIRRSGRKGGQVYTVSLGDEVGHDQQVSVAYTYRVLVQQHGHVLHLDLVQPTKDFTAELWYGDCGIRFLNVLDYLSGPRQPRVGELAATDPSPSVQVSYPGWTFPKGGVAFVWVLEREMQTVTTKQK
jgi:hypothetical protein